MLKRVEMEHDRVSPRSRVRPDNVHPSMAFRVQSDIATISRNQASYSWSFPGMTVCRITETTTEQVMGSLAFLADQPTHSCQIGPQTCWPSPRSIEPLRVSSQTTHYAIANGHPAANPKSCHSGPLY